MSNPTQPEPFTGLSIEAVTHVTGLCRKSIYQAAAEAQLGSPGHFVFLASEIYYTGAGVCQLVHALDAMGHSTAARALAEAIRQRRQILATAARVTSPDELRGQAVRWDNYAALTEEAAA